MKKIICALTVLAFSVACQPPANNEVAQKLEKRVAELEKTVKELKKHLKNHNAHNPSHKRLLTSCLPVKVLHTVPAAWTSLFSVISNAPSASA